MTPRYAASDHRELCLAAARHLLAEREARLPGLVERGKITAAESARRQELARCLVAQWRWVVDPASPPQPAFDEATLSRFGAPDWELVADLREAAARARTIAQRGTARPGDVDPHQLADLYEALAWLQRPPLGWGIVDQVAAARAATAQWRAQAQRRLAA